MKEIQLHGGLSKGKVAIVDDEDFERISAYRWRLGRDGYARTQFHLGKHNGKKKTKSVSMHRMVVNAPDGMLTDHKNGNRLDNRRSNLRLCTTKQNAYNTRWHNVGPSGYVGVSWSDRYRLWTVYITQDGQKRYCGTYDTPEKAALVYNYFAQEYRGEFAVLNSISPDLMSPEAQDAFLKEWVSRKGMHRRNTSGYRGVTWSKQHSKWISQMYSKHQRYFLGLYSSKSEAAMAYDEMARRLGLPHTVLNFPEMDEVNNAEDRGNPVI